MNLFENNDPFSNFGNFHNLKNLGEPNRTERFEEGGVTYELKIWQTPNGIIKTMDIIDINVNPEDLDFSAIKNEIKITPEDYGSLFRNGGTIPMGFLNLLQEAARYQEHSKFNMSDDQEPTLEDLEEQLNIAIEHEDYEHAAVLKKEIDALKNGE